MGACKHGQGGHLPLEIVVVFCALGVTVKRSVDQLFMHYFHKFSSAPRFFAGRGRFWRVGVVYLVVLACVWGATTKKVVNFLGKSAPCQRKVCLCL